jgi:hypothetical protein
VPICRPSDVSTGTPVLRAMYEVGAPRSVMAHWYPQVAQASPPGG